MVFFSDTSKEVHGAQGITIVISAKTWLSFRLEPHASESMPLATTPTGK
jgi:hypothetical protein